MADGIKKAIVIGSTTKTGEWLDMCLTSFGSFNEYPIIVVVNNDFELGKLKWVYENTDIEDIFLMHDSIQVKDTSIFKAIFDDCQSIAITDSPCPFGMFWGKYKRSVLEHLEIPVTKTKQEAVEQEMVFNQKYASSCEYKVICPEIRNGEVFEEKFGRTNMILENNYFKKFKATWSRNQL